MLATLVVLASTLAGCGGDDSSEPTPTVVPTEAAGANNASTTGTPANVDAPQAAYGEIVWAASIDPQTKAPVERVEQFPVDAAAIYAVIPVARVAAGTELTADWTYNDTPIDGVAASAVIPAFSEDLVWAEFHLQRSAEQPWPDGTYRITIRQNGRIVAESTTEVGE